MAEVKIPEVGESITEGILVEWIAAEGTQVKVDDPLFVLETDKITMDVELITPIAMEQGLRFAIREGGRTVGAGAVTKINE